uniref:LAGLIDADG endonuclease n=1 Tax=Monilinia fructicola TaxID=38448 RepID=A0A889XPP5_MONFR|nr:LAGLIDADG endonuclease [Monilinia fructicola]QRF72222.1 LAGLIDADG endonuclease [Monilinia fructicola]
MISLGICNNNNMDFLSLLIIESFCLPTIGLVHKNALKKVKNKALRLNKQEYLKIPSAFLAFLVGFIDGDGYIQISKTTKGFISIKLVISLQLEDISTLEYIHSVLKFGKLNIYKDNKTPSCKLVISRTDLQEILFPLLIHHNIFFLTKNRQAQFDLAMYIFKENIKIYNELPTKEKIPIVFKLPKRASDYLNLGFFKNWIVGFTAAEGSFYTSNNTGYFALRQKGRIELFEAFMLLFTTEKKRLNENNLYNLFVVSSRVDLDKVINLFSFSGLHPLVGLKILQYFKWLEDLKNNSRYANLSFPK